MVEELVHIIDDDPLIRSSLQKALEVQNYKCRVYSTAREYLEALPVPPVGCLILDLQMGGMSGLELEAELKSRKQTLPIIFLTGHATVSLAVEAVKRGAFDFLEKPCDPQRLIDMLAKALAKSRNKAENLDLLEDLTPRELEVYNLLVVGKTNKGVAAELGITTGTAEFHRSNLMKKLGAHSLEDLISLAHVRNTIS